MVKRTSSRQEVDLHLLFAKRPVVLPWHMATRAQVHSHDRAFRHDCGCPCGEATVPRLGIQLGADHAFFLLVWL